MQKNHSLLLKKLKNTESVQLCTVTVLQLPSMDSLFWFSTARASIAFLIFSCCSGLSGLAAAPPSEGPAAAAPASLFLFFPLPFFPFCAGTCKANASAHPLAVIQFSTQVQSWALEVYFLADLMRINSINETFLNLPLSSDFDQRARNHKNFSRLQKYDQRL